MEEGDEAAVAGNEVASLLPQIEFDDDPEPDNYGEDVVSAPLGRTLLPAPVASVVSLATRSTSFALRVGTFIGGCGFTAAKFTTLTSLELGRGILEGILTRAGRDTIGRSRSELGRDNAETILEKSLESLHSTITQIVFWTTTGFQVTGTTVSTLSQISQLFLSSLDQFFGSTDSSRAVASIITLVRREFQNPATGVKGESVGVVDIVLGLCGLAYLQNWCRKMIQDDRRRLGQEEVVWDIVVLNDDRIDVHEDSLYGIHKGTYVHANGDETTLVADSGSEDDVAESQLRRQIMRTLPKDANVIMSTATNVTKTITVEVKGTPDASLLALPGADLIESEITTPDCVRPGMRDATPTYRVVYRISRDKVRKASLQSTTEDDDDTKSRITVLDSDASSSEDEATSKHAHSRPPPVPAKSPRSKTTSLPRKDTQVTEYPRRQHRSSSIAGSTGSKSPTTSPKERATQIPAPKQTSTNAANQKKVRQPLDGPKRSDDAPAPRRKSSKDHENGGNKSGEKKGGLRNALKKGSNLANLLSRENSSDNIAGSKAKPAMKPPWGSNKPQSKVSDRKSSLVPAREAPRPPQRGNPNYFSSRDLGHLGDSSLINRAPSRSSYLSIHHRRSSIISQTDTISIHSFEGGRPDSPTMYRRSKISNDSTDILLRSPSRRHNRASSRLDSLYAPSIYTLATIGSQTSLLYHQRSAFADPDAINSLRNNGMVEGTFPHDHMLRNIMRYSRYASAAYGAHFLRYMGIAKKMPLSKALEEASEDVRSFAHHTGLPPNSILLDSFVDPQGGSDSTGSTETGIPLVHTIAVDEESKAVVLACRGTLGFEDVLADLMCEYDELTWRGHTYKVHKGIHASARRLLYGRDGQVLLILKEALNEFPDFGLVLCGHSLGGGVTALLGVMLAEPAPFAGGFVTSANQQSLLTDGSSAGTDPAALCLPSGRPIHVYAYGPPSTMSPSLHKATRGLITSIVHGNDLVPYLSLGVLHDFQALALAFKSDNSEAKAEVRRRIWQGLQSGLADKWYDKPNKPNRDEQDRWAYAALKTLRASMMSSKLLPPGEVFTVECTPAIRREAFMAAGEEQIGKPAKRIVMKYIRDVESYFREIKFGASMLTDHSPGRYEDALRRLTFGVLDS